MKPEMQNYNRIQILLGVFGVAILIGILFWNCIKLPFINPWGITGPLVQSQYNPSNNLVRFVSFISLPVVALLIMYWLQKMGYSVMSFTMRDRDSYNDRDMKIETQQQHLFVVFFLLFVLFSALLLPTYHANGPLDTFHEGETLGPAISYMNGLIPYKDYIIVHGVIQDPLRSVFAFKIFGKTIGAVRTLESITSMITLLMLGVFLLQFFRRNALYVFATFWILIMMHMTGFVDINKVWMIPILIAPRDITTMAFLLVLPFLQKLIRTELDAIKHKKFLGSVFFFAFIPIATFAYSIDRGFYMSTALVIMAFILYVCYFHKSSLRLPFIGSITAGILLGVVVLGAVLKWDFIDFFQFSFLIMPRYKELMDGFVYPVFDPKFLFVCVIIAFNLYWMFYKFLQEFHESKGKLWISLSEYIKKYLVEFILLLLSIFFFRSALGRSDWEHVAYSSYPAYLLFLAILFKYQFHWFFSRFIFQKAMIDILLAFMLLLSLVKTVQVLSTNVLSEKFPIQKSDEFFIPSNEKSTIQYLKDHLKTNENFVTMTSEASWYYFVNKPCPIRFPVIWFAMPPFYQKEVTEDMEKNHVKYVIYKNAHWANAIDGFPNEVRLPIIIKYIQEHYQPDQQLEDNEIWIRKE